MEPTGFHLSAGPERETAPVERALATCGSHTPVIMAHGSPTQGSPAPRGTAGLFKLLQLLQGGGRTFS